MAPRIRRMLIRNYKSLAQVEVEFGAFTVLVGPNGSGKSNLIDALAFVEECLADSIELAFKNRGGIAAVRRKSGGHPTHIGIRLDVDLANDVRAEYSFEIAAKPGEKFRVARERCVVAPFMDAAGATLFEIRDGVFSTPIPGIRPKVAADRLALFAASATEEFRGIYDFLTSIHRYSIVPEEIRRFQEPDPGDFLHGDGSNAAAVLKRLQDEKRSAEYERICRLLARVSGGITKVEYRAVGPLETIRFRQDVGQRDPWTFDALSMSDGTLRVLGLLLSVYQTNRPAVTAIEEPEATIHPAAAELVVEVLLDAARSGQVLLTTHSPDLLDSKSVSDTQIRAVEMHRGATVVGSLCEASRDAIRERLYTPGELLRTGELRGEEPGSSRPVRQLDLFGPVDRVAEGHS